MRGVAGAYGLGDESLKLGPTLAARGSSPSRPRGLPPDIARGYA